MKIFLAYSFILSTILNVIKENIYDVSPTKETSFRNSENSQEFNFLEKNDANDFNKTLDISLNSLNSYDTEKNDSAIFSNSELDYSCEEYFDNSHSSFNFPIKQIITGSVKELIKKFEGKKLEKFIRKSRSLVKSRVEFFENKNRINFLYK